jgi:hypothetical protein
LRIYERVEGYPFRGGSHSTAAGLFELWSTALEVDVDVELANPGDLFKLTPWDVLCAGRSGLGGFRIVREEQEKRPPVAKARAVVFHTRPRGRDLPGQMALPLGAS